MRNKDGYTVRYQTWFNFVDTEEEAKEYCEIENASHTPYVRKKHPAHYTPWSSTDGKEHKFICWTVVPMYI